MNKLEQWMDRHAIRNLSMKLTIVYAVGYMLYFLGSFSSSGNAFRLLTLDVYRVIHGFQIWRLVTWILMPINTGNLFLMLISLYFFYWIGSVMESTWGSGRFNLYIFSGMLLTIVSAFLMLGWFYVFHPEVTALDPAGLSEALSYSFTMYYVNMSVLLAYAATYPDNVVLLMFIIPIKMKWLGIADAAMMIFSVISSIRSGEGYAAFIVLPALLNFVLFWLLGGTNLQRIRPKEVKRRREFRQAAQPRMVPPGQGRHKCAICGRTEVTDPQMEFRYCSKCMGNYEYCSEHLFTHQHVKG